MLGNKRVNFVISLLVAIALWSFVIYATDPVQTKIVKDVPVTLVNTDLVEARGLTAVDTDEIRIDVNVEASRSVLSKITPDQIDAVADVSDCVEGENTVAVDVSFRQDAKVYRDLTITVKVNFEQIVTESRNVKVIYKMKGSRTGDASVSDDLSVDVTGARSTVADVASAAVFISRDDIEGKSGVIYKEMFAVDKKGNKVDDVTLSEKYASVTVTPYNEKTVTLVTDIEGEPAAGYEIGSVDVPDTVRIMGNAESLKQVDSVSAETVDISGLSSSKTFDLEIRLPEGCVLSPGQDMTASVHVFKEGSQRKTYSIGIDEIRFENLSDELEVSSCDDVQVSGIGLIKIDIKVSADLDGLEEGTHEVRVSVSAREGDVISYSPKTIQVTLVRK